MSNLADAIEWACKKWSIDFSWSACSPLPCSKWSVLSRKLTPTFYIYRVKSTHRLSATRGPLLLFSKIQEIFTWICTLKRRNTYKFSCGTLYPINSIKILRRRRLFVALWWRILCQGSGRQGWVQGCLAHTSSPSDPRPSQNMSQLLQTSAALHSTW